ncbi:MAG: cephalosporin hydroxylase family protein [Pseudomonadota bacterium]
MTSDPLASFAHERRERLDAFGRDEDFKKQALDWVSASMNRQYIYNFDWLGRPIIQYPEDIMSVQELIWQTRPDVIVETGIAHGGSVILSASMLAMLDYSDAIKRGEMLDPRNPKRKVIGIDIDIRQHNRDLIEAHPMSAGLVMIEGSSIDPDVVAEVQTHVDGAERVLVFLDSMHTHDHVLAELEAYAPMVTKGSYCVVFDTIVEDLPKGYFKDRPWNPGNSPKSALRAYLEDHPEFEIDSDLHNKLMITAVPHGHLKRVG